ncbi:MAG: hypothetical protein R6U19_04100 [Bacteroidales bacterium]
MQFVYLILSVLLFGSLSARDTLKVTVNNPAPRVNEVVKIHCSQWNEVLQEVYQSPLNDAVQEAIDVAGDERGADYMYNVLGQFKFSSAGTYTLDAVPVSVNKKEYVIREISLEVLPAFPAGEGMIFRKAQFQGETYVYLEYYVEEALMADSPSEKGWSDWDFKKDIKEKYFKKRGGTHFSAKNQEGKKINVERLVYKLKEEAPTGDKLVIDESLISNFPEGIRLQTETINLD